MKKSTAKAALKRVIAKYSGKKVRDLVIEYFSYKRGGVRIACINVTQGDHTSVCQRADSYLDNSISAAREILLAETWLVAALNDDEVFGEETEDLMRQFYTEERE